MKNMNVKFRDHGKADEDARKILRECTWPEIRNLAACYLDALKGFPALLREKAEEVIRAGVFMNVPAFIQDVQRSKLAEILGEQEVTP